MEVLTEVVHTVDPTRYAKCVENSRRMRFDMDVIRGRTFDFTQKLLPDGPSREDRLTFLTASPSEVQGRSYANIFGLACASAAGGARSLRLQDGRVVRLRAARPDDVPAVQQFVRELSEVSRRNRFFAPVRELTPDQLDRVTRTADPRELALVAETFDGSEPRIVGLAQHALCEPPNAEFALVVSDDHHRQGIGMQLIGVLAEHAACAGIAALVGFVRYDNWPMLTLLARLGFELLNSEEPHVIRVAKPLDARGLAA